MSHKIQVYGLSDIGLVRKRNEDVWAELPELKFYVLADGMGGHRAGDVAAREAVQATCYLMHKKLAREARGAKIVEDVITQVNRIVHKLSCNHQTLKGMGTTLCCLYIYEGKAICGHVGDSRIYRFRKGELTPLTRDHSLMRDLLDSGELKEEDTSDFLYKNIVTKAIGLEAQVLPTVKVSTVEPGDRFMLCSDGLTDLLNDAAIEQIIAKSGLIDEAAMSLVNEAIEHGGLDNVTVVMLEVD